MLPSDAKELGVAWGHTGNDTKHSTAKPRITSQEFPKKLVTQPHPFTFIMFLPSSTIGATTELMPRRDVSPIIAATFFQSQANKKII
jgi:hypothetical protein